MSGAQTAFAALQQDLPNLAGGQANGQTSNSNNPLSVDFQALAQALQAGKLSDAQTAFAKLQQDFQTAHSAGHRHHHQGNHASTPSSNTSTASSAGVDNDGDHDGSGQQALNVQA